MRKTQILTERIRHAHANGIAYADMLCLTFTNRAARGMGERMQQELTDDGTAGIYVGNVHRFCSRFLFENGIIENGTSVIDDDDAVSILASYLNEDETAVRYNRHRRRDYAAVFQTSALMHQIEHGHPRQLRIHPECLTADDIGALRTLCRLRGVEFTAAAMSDIYRHTTDYRTLLEGNGCDYGERMNASRTLTKLNLAYEYGRYKRANMLVDFQDLLILTYDALTADPHDGPGDTPRYKRYPWIQVDEVQDLNPLQLAIVGLLTDKNFNTVMFLGDEQQAIFSFMGAKLSTIEALKDQCAGNIHHLSVNHRSRSYLLDVFNTFATNAMGIDKSLLPQADNDLKGAPGDLMLLESHDYDSEIADVARLTQRLCQADATSRTAVIVISNNDADAISTAFANDGIAHFKVSGDDIFASPAMKLLLAHANILTRDTDFMSWARLLAGLGIFQTAYAARNFVRASLNHAIIPTDYLRADGGTYTSDFTAAVDSGDIVVFDTETTGLNVFEDDIVQIAAVRMRHGKVVEGSQLSLYIATDRQIPAMLGDTANPIIEEMRNHKLLGHREALMRFVDYVAGAPLIGHNADFDYHILACNLSRYCGITDIGSVCPTCFDTLRMTRLFCPGFKAYKLKALLAELHLQGHNSHLADDDVDATCGLVAYCYTKATQHASAQRAFLDKERVTRAANLLRSRYAATYQEARRKMYVRQTPAPASPSSPLADELLRVHSLLTAEGLVEPLPSLGRLLGYITADVVDNHAEPSLAEQLTAHIMQLNTMKEADLCGSSSISDRVFVTTVHKAKGLEFDNVIVFDAVDGRWPNFYSQASQTMLSEDARKFYVAITRAMRRLIIAYSQYRLPAYGGAPRRQNLTRFMASLAPMFMHAAAQDTPLPPDATAHGA